MHFTLKRVRNDLERYLSKGSEEQIIEIYEFVRAEYLKIEKGKKEIEKLAEQLVDNKPPFEMDYEIKEQTEDKPKKKAGRPKKNSK